MSKRVIAKSALNLLKVIQSGFTSGNRLVWNGRSFEHYSKKIAKSEVASRSNYTLTLEEVSEHVIDFFKEHPELPLTQTVSLLKKRLAPYKGIYGWWLCLTFRSATCYKIISTYSKLIDSIYDRPLASLPSAGIQMGIKNLGNSCWFNSALKFLASTTLFDDAINQGESKLHKIFKRAINELRTGGHGERLSDDTLSELKTICQKEFPTLSFYRQQHSDEFFRLLLERLSPSAGSNITTKQEVDQAGLTPFFFECSNRFTLLEKDDFTKRAASDHFKGEMVLDIDPKEFTLNAPIDLNACLQKQEEVEVRPDNINENRKFKRGLVATYLPDNLIVNLKRVQKVGDEVHGREQKCSRDVKLIDNQISFELYELIEGKVQKVEDVYYRIDAAITHIGGASGGHYVCYVRNLDGSTTLHNDSNVSFCAAEIGAQALFFRLTKVPKAKMVMEV